MTYDKKWPVGPWDQEPNEHTWGDAETGLLCYARRNGVGAWCGYVQSAGNRYYGDLNVHGGVTYTGNLDHVSDKPGYWVGFDCAHAWDVMPGLPTLSAEAEYRDLAYVVTECAKLAKQIEELESTPQIKFSAKASTKQKLWVVYKIDHVDGDGSGPHGVFTTEDLAYHYVERCKMNNPGDHYSYEVTPFLLDDDYVDQVD